MIWFRANIISLKIKESACFVFVDAYFLYIICILYNTGLLMPSFIIVL